MKNEAARPAGALAPLPRKLRLFYGVGEFGQQFSVMSLSMFLLFFYTDVLKIDPKAAGVLLLIAKFWDARERPADGRDHRAQQRQARQVPHVPSALVGTGGRVLLADVQRAGPEPDDEAGVRLCDVLRAGSVLHGHGPCVHHADGPHHKRPHPARGAEPEPRVHLHVHGHFRLQHDDGPCGERGQRRLRRRLPRGDGGVRRAAGAGLHRRVPADARL